MKDLTKEGEMMEYCICCGIPRSYYDLMPEPSAYNKDKKDTTNCLHIWVTTHKELK